MLQAELHRSIDHIQIGVLRPLKHSVVTHHRPPAKPRRVAELSIKGTERPPLADVSVASNKLGIVLLR